METIEDIIRELRNEPLAENDAKPWLHYLADRIEKAYQKDVKHLNELVRAYRARNAELKSSRDLWFSRADELRVRCDELYEELKKEPKCYK